MGAMGATSSGPMSSGGMRGASGNMGMPTPTFNPFSRHGSDEQVVRDSYMDMTPPVTTTRNTPRDSRTRSPRSPRNEEQQPVGFTFRMNAAEQTLREQHAELATQRLMISQMSETIQQMLVDKETTGQRLDQVFALVDQKYQETKETTGQRLDQVVAMVDQKYQEAQGNLKATQDIIQDKIENHHTHIIKQLEQTMMARLDHLQAEIANMRIHPPAAPEAPPGISVAPLSPQTEVPQVRQPPQSWTGQTQSVFSGANLSREVFDSSPAPVTSASPVTHHGNQWSGSSAHFGLSPSVTPSASAAQPQGYARNTGITSATQYFSYGSPQQPNWSPLGGNNGHWSVIGGMQGQPMSNRWAPGAGSNMRAFDPKDWDVQGRKVTKELRVFDGDLVKFDNWRRRIRDHFVSVNCHYTEVFKIIENNKSPIRWSELRATYVQELPNLNWEWVASHLWSFTSSFLTDTQLDRRMALVQGEEFNGIEFWRALYQENIGGSVQLAAMEHSHFISFPKCSSATGLHAHLGQWMQLKATYGSHLPEAHLIYMLWGIIPDDLKEEIKKNKDVRDSLHKQVAWLYEQIAEKTDEKLSRWNLSKLQSQLKHTPKNTTGIHQVSATTNGDEPQEPLPPPVPDLASLNANMERMINAAVARASDRGRSSNRTPPGSRNGSNSSQRRSSNNRRIPSASFKGCWCCGGEDHKRQDCKKFKALIAANGGKVPKDYKGAWETHLSTNAKSGSPATKVSAISAQAFSGEHAETTSLFPILRSPPPISTANKFHAFESEASDDDDESEVMRALAALTPSVSRASDKSISQRARKQRGQQSRSVQLKAIAKDIASGKVSLHDLDLEEENEYEFVWALVDSGAGANVAKCNKLGQSQAVRAPQITLSTANGDLLPNSGARRVTSYLRDGTPCHRVFYDADVEMPILSVAELSKEGPKGSEIRLRRRDGFLEDNASGKRQYIVRRRGVYFMKMYMKRDLQNEMDFARRGAR